MVIEKGDVSATIGLIGCALLVIGIFLMLPWQVLVTDTEERCTVEGCTSQ